MKKPDGSGRKAGTPNKSTQELFDICEKHGVDVFESMVILAAGEADSSKKFERLEKLAKYLYPQRKAVEHSADSEPGFRVIIEDYKAGEK